MDVADAAATGFVMEDSTVVPEFPSVLVDGVRGSNFTLRRVSISGTTDGVKVHGVGNVRIEDSYIFGLEHWDFDPYQTNGSHSDGIQILSGQGVSIVGNTFGGPASASTSLPEWNAAIQITQNNGPVSEVVIQNNWIDGGNCSVNVNAIPMASIGGITVAHNRFGRTTKYSNCAVLATKASISFSGNTWMDGSTPQPWIKQG